MNTTMNIITTDVRRIKSYSTNEAWTAFTIINGKETSITCMHTHTRKELAEKCAKKHLPARLTHLPTATIITIDDNLHQVIYIDDKNRNCTQRFRYTKETK